MLLRGLVVLLIVLVKLSFVLRVLVLIFVIYNFSRSCIGFAFVLCVFTLLGSTLVAEGLLILLGLLRKILTLGSLDVIDVLKFAAETVVLLFRVFLSHTVHLFNSLADFSRGLLTLMETLFLIVGIVIVLIFIKLRLILLITFLVLTIIGLYHILFRLLNVLRFAGSRALVLLRGRGVASLVLLFVARSRAWTLSCMRHRTRALRDVHSIIGLLFNVRLILHQFGLVCRDARLIFRFLAR